MRTRVFSDKGNNDDDDGDIQKLISIQDAARFLYGFAANGSRQQRHQISPKKEKGSRRQVSCGEIDATRASVSSLRAVEFSLPQ